MSIRITGLQEVATLQSGDFVAIDNTTTGTHKFDATKLGAGVEANLAPTYSSAATYALGDFCIYDGVMYKCTTAITSPENWTASHWTQTSAGVALADKVDKVSGKGLSENDFTNALKTKLDGIEAGAEANVQADWSQTNTGADDYIKNKPTDATTTTAGLMSAADKTKLNGIAAGAEVNVQADWNEADSSADDYIKNKPSTATSSTNGLMSSADKAKLDGIASGAEVNVQADWAQTDNTKDDYIKNKPVAATTSTTGLMSAADKTKLDGIASGAEVNVQADWNQTNSTADDYIQNKPTSDTTLSIAGAFADAKTVGDALGELDETEKLYMSNIPDTTQTITLTNGMLSQILHKSGNTTVRTDTFAYGSGSFTETRTLGTGASLTIVTDLSTFGTTVTYTGA